MVILDTDILTLIQQTASREYAILRTRLRLAGVDPVFTTIVSFEEQSRGWLAVAAAAKTNERLEWAYRQLRELLSSYQKYAVLDFDMPAIMEFDRQRDRGVRIGTMDLRIASIALTHDAVLVTRNLVDFLKVPGLRVEDWTKPAA